MKPSRAKTSGPATATAADTTASWVDTSAARAVPRTPNVLGSVENAPLSKEVLWVDCHLRPGVIYRLQSLVGGTSGTADKAALIRFDGAGSGEGLITSTSSGPHLRLRTGPGLMRTDRLFTVAQPVSQYGLAGLADSGSLVLKSLTIEPTDQAAAPVDFFFSFDVEAALTRARANHIDALVWGRLGGGEYGIRRLCDVLEQHRVKGNFLVDFGSCLREGERQIRAIVDFLAGRGHEVHMHLHPADLARQWGMPGGEEFQLDKFSYDSAMRLLDFTVRNYRQYVGQDPRVFRSGAYRMGRELVLAAGSLGIEALTNVRNGVVGDPAIGGDAADNGEPFVWQNGVVEIPVDASSQEVAPWESYLGKYDAAIRRKRTERTFNIVMHSWSLMRKNAEGIFTEYAPEYEERIHQMCEHARQHGTPRGYSEYLDLRRVPRPVVRLSSIRVAEPEKGSVPAVTPSRFVACIVCDASFAPAAMESDRCPSCGAQARHRQLKYVVDNFGNAFDGKRVVAYEAARLKAWGFLSRAAEIDDFDPTRSPQRPIARGTADCFVGLHLIQSRGDAVRLTLEVARILKKTGLFVSTVPYRGNGASSGGDAKDGLYLQEYLDLLSARFRVSSVPGYDSVTGAASRIFFAYKGQ